VYNEFAFQLILNVCIQGRTDAYCRCLQTKQVCWVSTMDLFPRCAFAFPDRLRVNLPEKIPMVPLDLEILWFGSGLGFRSVWFGFSENCRIWLQPMWSALTTFCNRQLLNRRTTRELRSGNNTMFIYISRITKEQCLFTFEICGSVLTGCGYPVAHITSSSLSLFSTLIVCCAVVNLKGWRPRPLVSHCAHSAEQLDNM